MPRTVLFQVLILASTFFQAPARADLLTPARGTSCGVFQSCIIHAGQSAQASTRNMSVTWDERACDLGEFGLIPPNMISACEQALKSRRASHNQRAAATVNLGYAYASYPSLSGNDVSRMQSEATRHFAAALAIDPGSLDARFAMAITRIERSREDVEAARLEFDKIIAEFPQDWRGHFGKVRVELAARNFSQALEAARTMENIMGKQSMALILHARMLEYNGMLWEAYAKYAEATVAFEREKPALPGNLVEQPPWVGWAEVADKLQLHAEALEIWKAYLSLLPAGKKEQMDFVRLARFSVHAGNYGAAVEAYEKAKAIVGIVPANKIEAELALTRVKAGLGKDEVVSVVSGKKALTLRQILKLQLALREGGFSSVKVTGKLDVPTIVALTDCARQTACKAIAGIDL